MSTTAYTWISAFHIFGVLMWMGTMIGLANILVAHAEADLGSRPAFHKLGRACAMAMDIGATIAMVFGLIMLFANDAVALKQGGYMHAKLTLVVLLLLTSHGFLRVKVRKYREGKVVPLPVFMPPLLSLTALAVIILVVVRPF
jgi:putative membrane protein